MKKKLLATVAVTVLTLSMSLCAYAQKENKWVGSHSNIHWTATTGCNPGGNWQDSKLEGYGNTKTAWAQCGSDRTTSPHVGSKAFRAYVQDYGPYITNIFKAGQSCK